ncbi:MAG: hypothetical protein HYT11_00485 [Candidatus Levybacteria bacterium]|nr:hypothetical protein [Candidatus Levybacteria bacterium]
MRIILLFLALTLLLFIGSAPAVASGPPRIFIILPTDKPEFTTPIGLTLGKVNWANITFGGDSPFVDLSGDNNPAGQRSNPFPFVVQ